MPRLLLHLILMACPIFIWGADLKLLTPAEADAIVAAEEATKKSRKAARIAEMNQARVISEGRSMLPDGRTVLVREVAPSLRSALVPRQKHENASELSLEQFMGDSEEAQLRQHKVKMFSCTVYDRSITMLRWKHKGEDHVAYTNADFNYLRGVMTVRTETDRFDYFMGIGNVASNDGYGSYPSLPEMPVFLPGRSSYVHFEGDRSESEAVACLEALLAYYDANLEELKVEYQRNEALSDARERYRANNTEKQEDFILQFWVPEGSDE